VFNGVDVPYPGWTAFIDNVVVNGLPDPGEQTFSSDDEGSYALTGLDRWHVFGAGSAAIQSRPHRAGGRVQRDHHRPERANRARISPTSSPRSLSATFRARQLHHRDGIRRSMEKSRFSNRSMAAR
jgi:hypothetical protein